MTAPASILLSAIFAVAVAAWCVAVYSAWQVTNLSPSGQRVSNYLALGWWRFAELENRIGPEVRPVLNRYRNAFFVFFACVLGTALAGVLAGNAQTSN
jgi:hypothetical protein